MPIDLKWVRSDPNQVREWQHLRRRRVAANPTDRGDCGDGLISEGDTDNDLVDTLLRKDELSRKNLRYLQEQKRSLKRLQLSLRPKLTQQAVVKVFDGSKKELTSDKDEENGQYKREDSAKSNHLPPLSTKRDDLIKEKKAIETKIRSAEANWKASLEDTYKTLCKLASPVAIMKVKGDGVDYDILSSKFLDTNVSTVVTPPLLLPDSHYRKSSLAMDLEQAWRQYTLRQFAAYIWVELPRGVSVMEMSSDSSRPPSPSHFPSISLDRAHELWGCYTSTSSPSTQTTSVSCPSCSVTSSMKSSSSDDRQPVVMLPSWIYLLTESLPNKSIWGEKELPRYTAIWSTSESQRSLQQISDDTFWLGHPKEYNTDRTGDQNLVGVLPGLSSIDGSFSLQLVALAAPSVVDAREIQMNLVEELENFYSSLLMGRGNDQSRKKSLKRVVIAAPDLHNHEWSRIEIHFHLRSSSDSSSNCKAKEENKHDTENRTTRNINTVRLGWVSHWGDAATRACNMAFSGGSVFRAGGKKKYNKSTGNASTKEYVHLIEACVIDDSASMWNKILFASSSAIVNLDYADFSTPMEKQILVDVPQVLVPYLVRPCHDLSSIPLEDLFLVEKSKMKTKEAVFGVLGDNNNTCCGHNEQQGPVIACSTDRLGIARLDGVCNQDGPKFPPFGLPSAISQGELRKRIRWEKLSCPYDFLFE